MEPKKLFNEWTSIAILTSFSNLEYFFQKSLNFHTQKKSLLNLTTQSSNQIHQTKGIERLKKQLYRVDWTRKDRRLDYLFFYEPNYFVDFSEIIIFYTCIRQFTKLRDYWFFDVAWNRWKINETDLDLLRNFTRFSRSRDVQTKSFIIIINSAFLDSDEKQRDRIFDVGLYWISHSMIVVKMTFCSKCSKLCDGV
jgi:hypothetical protein